MYPNRLRKANGLSGEPCDPCSENQMVFGNLRCMLFPDRLLLGAEMALGGTPIIGIDMCQTPWSQKLLQFDEHCIGLRSSYIR
jgi:hypothetical protein